MYEQQQDNCGGFLQPCKDPFKAAQLGLKNVQVGAHYGLSMFIEKAYVHCVCIAFL